MGTRSSLSAFLASVSWLLQLWVFSAISDLLLLSLSVSSFFSFLVTLSHSHKYTFLSLSFVHTDQ